MGIWHIVGEIKWIAIVYNLIFLWIICCFEIKVQRNWWVHNKRALTTLWSMDYIYCQVNYNIQLWGNVWIIYEYFCFQISKTYFL